MDTKPNLDKNYIKKQDTFTPDGYTRPGEPEKDNTQHGGSSIVDFDYNKYAEVERKATHTNAIAGLTFGILSIVVDWFTALIGLALGITGIVFSVKGRKEVGGKSMATGGLVCSIIGVVLASISIIMTFFLIGGIIGGALYL